MFQTGANRYGYVYGNPVHLVDPRGEIAPALALAPEVVNAAIPALFYLLYPPLRDTIRDLLNHYQDDPGEIENITLGAMCMPTIQNLYSKKAPQDAYDVEGAKAPGKPGKAEGFQNPKGGERWVRNPNGKGYGWEDRDGDVWMPTGPGRGAHGGPHWDVQGKDPRNVYPGGHVRYR